MKSGQAKVWIADSAFTGELNARIGVAERLGYDFDVIPLPENGVNHYREKLDRLDAERRRFDPMRPLILLSGTGEDTVSAFADFKRRSPKLLNVFLASILPAELNPRLFEYDIIATPELEGPNVVRTIGVAHNVTHSRIRAAQDKYGGLFAALEPPIFALLLGGNTLYCNGFDAGYARRLAARVRRIVSENHGSLIVTNSRRTPPAALDALLDDLAPLQPSFFDWCTSPREIYHAIIGAAEVIIATGDSLSMCSEGSFTGKPLLVDISEQATEIYHRQILEGLLRCGAARPIDDGYAPWSYTPIDTANQIATAIREKLQQFER